MEEVPKIPFNGSGVYTFPAAGGYPYQFNTIIDQNAVNSLLGDVSSALNVAATRDGQAVWTGSLNMGNNSISNVKAIAVLPSVGQTASQITFNNANPSTNSGFGTFGIDATAVYINSGVSGAGTQLPIQLRQGGTSYWSLATTGALSNVAPTGSNIALTLNETAGNTIQQWLDGTCTTFLFTNGASGSSFGTFTNHQFGILTNNTNRINVTTAGTVTIATPTAAGVALTVNAASGSQNGIKVVASGVDSCLVLSNTGASGRTWLLSSAGSGGAIPVGSFGLYDTTTPAAVLTAFSTDRVIIGNSLTDPGTGANLAPALGVAGALITTSFYDQYNQSFGSLTNSNFLRVFVNGTTAQGLDNRWQGTNAQIPFVIQALGVTKAELATTNNWLFNSTNDISSQFSIVGDGATDNFVANSDRGTCFNVVGTNHVGSGIITSAQGNAGIFTNVGQNAGIGGSLVLGGVWNSASPGGSPAAFGAISGIKNNNNSADFGGVLAFYTRVNGGSLTEWGRFLTNGGLQINTPGSGSALLVNAVSLANALVVTSSGAVSAGGTTTNDNAAAGFIGEYITATNSAGTAMTTGTALNVTSVSLTAGDWDVGGSVEVNFTSTNSGFEGASNTTSATLPAQYLTVTIGAVNSVALNLAAPVPQQRYSLSSTTTVFLVSISFFSAGAATAFGVMWARRRR